jgi:uncharacterized protein (DUF924 family)
MSYLGKLDIRRAIMTPEMTPENILDFWFEQLTPAQWWTKDLALDQEISTVFSSVHRQAASGELFSWRKTAKGALAEIIVLDQFSRNMFRGTPRSFAYDGMALILSQEVIHQGLDQILSNTERSFLYMPYMHSESLEIHQHALQLFETLNLPDALNFEKQHFDIIKQFGRYPHRNQILNRTTSKVEEAFLVQHTGF